MKILLLALLLLLSGCSQKEAAPRTAERVRMEAENERLPEATDTDKAETVPSPQPPPPPAEITLAEVSTPLLDDSASRVENINIACGAVNGIALYPGGAFSFNETVGRRTAENGYQDAPVIVNGHSEQGCGGGVCQVSSTLYMAASAAGLQIDERHPHSHSVPYAPDGMDATVVSGEKDLCFTNNTPNIITLFVWTDGKEVFSKITEKTS